MHRVLRTRFVVVGSFFSSGEGTREEDCFTYLVHSCRTALQHRVKFVRTLTSQKEIMAKRNFKYGQEKKITKTPQIYTPIERKKKNRHHFSNIPSDFGISEVF